MASFKGLYVQSAGVCGGGKEMEDGREVGFAAESACKEDELALNGVKLEAAQDDGVELTPCSAQPLLRRFRLLAGGNHRKPHQGD